MAVGVAVIVSAVVSATSLAQNRPQLCPANNQPDSWNNCFGQFQDIESGTTYSGNFVAGTFNGFGTLVSPDGTYSGEFRNGKFEGQGVLRLRDGTRFIGDWRDGLMEGQGRAINADGREVAGHFSKGNLVRNAAQPVPQAPPRPAPAPSGQAAALQPQPARVAQSIQPAPPPQPPAQAESVRPPTGRAAFIPSRAWDCSTGYYPHVSYSSLVTAGDTYTTSFRDGSGAKKGQYSRGSSKTAYGGIPIAWNSGTWSKFQGEFIPAGTIDPRTGKRAESDSVNVGIDSSYWSTSCYPK